MNQVIKYNNQQIKTTSQTRKENVFKNNRTNEKRDWEKKKMPWNALKTKNNSKTCQANKNDALIEAVAQKCSVRKGILTNFSKFTGNHLCQGLFF